MTTLAALTPELRQEVLQEARTELARSGGYAAAASMTQEQRSERARKAAAARWGK